MNKLKSIVFVLLILVCTSCATVFTGKNQAVTFQSEPSESTVVAVNKKGEETVVGTTPCTVEIAKKTKEVKFVKENYYTENFPISDKAKLNGWYYVNLAGCLVLIGAPSAIVDLVTGAIYVLPDTVKVELKKKTE